jgi:hypothetical protein
VKQFECDTRTPRLRAANYITPYFGRHNRLQDLRDATSPRRGSSSSRATASWTTPSTKALSSRVHVERELTVTCTGHGTRREGLGGLPQGLGAVYRERRERPLQRTDRRIQHYGKCGQVPYNSVAHASRCTDALEYHQSTSISSSQLKGVIFRSVRTPHAGSLPPTSSTTSSPTPHQLHRVGEFRRRHC